MSERIDISDQTVEICRRLDLPVNLVKEITLRPFFEAEVTLFATDENGSKFINDEGEPATHTATFDINA